MHSMFLITGATGGLGKAFAAECAARGWDLLITDLVEERLALLAGGLERAYGAEVHYRASDLTDASSRAGLIQYIRDRGMKLRGLINVAGLDHEGFFLERKSDQITSILRLNIESTLLMTHTVLAARDYTIPFRILNVSSLGAYFSMPIKATYAASKRFLLDFSVALRNELRDQNVTVTVLCPAGLPTNEVCLKAIEAQGIMGHLTTENIGTVVYQAIEATLHGKAIVIPGVLNRVLLWISGLLPATTIAEVIGTRWRATQQNSLQE